MAAQQMKPAVKPGLLIFGLVVTAAVISLSTAGMMGRGSLVERYCPLQLPEAASPYAAQLRKYTPTGDSGQDRRYVGSQGLAAASQAIPRGEGEAPPLPPWDYNARQLRATHYFSTGNPLDFWERLELSHLEQELRQIQLDGFDAIIIVIPWGGFQVSVDPVLYDPWLYSRLHAVLAAARAAGIYVVARIGYSHNYNPDNFLRAEERCGVMLTVQAKLMPAWTDYVRSLHSVFQAYDNFMFAFTSWEDNFCVIEVMGASLEERKKIAKASGFHEFLAASGATNASEAPVPANDGSDPEAVRKWRDFYQSHWKKILNEGRAIMPHLTMEVRIDSDPIFLPDGTIDWYANDMLPELGPEVPRAIYYASFWGAENKNQSMTAAAALGKLAYLLEKTGQRANTTRLFVEQFNFVDNTPNFEGVHDYIAPAEVPAFLAGAETLLRQHAMGYGLWSYRTYRESHLYNPSFEKGFHGWTVAGDNASIVTDPRGDAAALLRARGGPVTVQLAAPFHARHACDGRSTTYHVCATYHLLEGGPGLEVVVNGKAQRVELVLGDAPAEACRTFTLAEGPARMNVTFVVPQDSAVVLDDVDIFCHLQTLDVYSDTGEPQRYLPPVRELNYALGRPVS